jgi:hypothetical protein
MSAVRAFRGLAIGRKLILFACGLKTAKEGFLVRTIMAIGLAAVLLIPAFTAGAGATQEVGKRTEWTSDVSAAKKNKGVKRKAAPKEQYLRAVPSTPPPGAKQ